MMKLNIKKYIKKNKELIDYIICGLLTTVVSVSIYFILTRTICNINNPFELQIANICSWVGAVLFAYVVNRIFVFASKNKNILQEFCMFVSFRILSLLLDMFCMFMIVTILNMYDIFGKIVSQIVVTLTNYVLSKFIVFKK